MEHLNIEICCRERKVHLRKFISFYLVDEENNIYVDVISLQGKPTIRA